MKAKQFSISSSIFSYICMCRIAKDLLCTSTTTPRETRGSLCLPVSFPPPWYMYIAMDVHAGLGSFSTLIPLIHPQQINGRVPSSIRTMAAERCCIGACWAFHLGREASRKNRDTTSSTLALSPGSPLKGPYDDVLTSPSPKFKHSQFSALGKELTSRTVGISLDRDQPGITNRAQPYA